MDKQARGAAMTAMMLALTASAFMGDQGGIAFPRLPEPKPKGYGVHLSKAQRKGKSWSELQALRASV